MKSILLRWFLLLSTGLHAQDYLDLLSVGYSYAPPTAFNNTPGANSTTLNLIELNLLLPVPVTPKTALITGFNGYLNRLSLESGAPETELYTAALQLGVNRTYSKGWSSSHILFPRRTGAADQDRFSFQLGMANLLQKKSQEGRSLGFGFYINTEEQGLLLVPLFSYYHRSKAGSWEINALLPARADFTFRLDRSLRAGIGFEGLGNSFALHLEPYGPSYVQRSAVELSPYLQIPLSKNVLLNTRLGYSFFRNYRIFEADDTVKFSFLNMFINKQRNSLNTSVSDGFFLSCRIIYRYALAAK